MEKMEYYKDEYTVKDLAVMKNYAPDTIHQIRYRNPEQLPKDDTEDNRRQLVWYRETLEAFFGPETLKRYEKRLQQHEMNAANSN